MIGTIDCKTNDVDATVGDQVEIRRDGSVILRRCTTFHTDSEDDRPFRFFKNETLGGAVRDEGTIDGDESARLDLYTGRTPGHLVIDLAATARAGRPIALLVQSELLPPSRLPNLEYTVAFFSPQAVQYSISVSPFVAELTLPERFQFEVSPVDLKDRITRDAISGRIDLAGAHRISAATPPFAFTGKHSEDLPSTKLLQYYRDKFSQ